MDFKFSDTQQQIVESVERFLAVAATSVRARESLQREPDGFDPELWQGLADLGVPGIAIPEAYGGIGLTDFDLCVVAQVVGRWLVRSPIKSTAYWAAEAILRLGSDAQKAAWLPRFANGTAVASFVDINLSGFEPLAQSGNRLTGILPVVAAGMSADVLVIVSDDFAWLVDMDEVGAVRQPLETIDLLEPSCRVELTAVQADQMPGESLDATRKHLRRRAAVLIAFEQLGGCEAAINGAVAYAKERQAFGRAIGSFQAVKHLLVNMYVAAELARSTCYFAGWTLAVGDERLSMAAAAAHLSATEAYRRCAADAIQVHGGIGFTWELDCHLRYRRANQLALSLGSARYWEEELIEAQLQERHEELIDELRR